MSFYYRTQLIIITVMLFLDFYYRTHLIIIIVMLFLDFHYRNQLIIISGVIVTSHVKDETTKIHPRVPSKYTYVRIYINEAMK